MRHVKSSKNWRLNDRIQYPPLVDVKGFNSITLKRNSIELIAELMAWRNVWRAES